MAGPENGVSSLILEKHVAIKTILKRPLESQAFPHTPVWLIIKPPVYPDSTDLIPGSWDPGIKRRKREKEGGRRNLLQTFLYSWPSHRVAPLSGSSALKLLYQDTPQACSVSPCSIKALSTSFFLPPDKTLIPFRQLIQLDGTHLCLITSIPAYCLCLHFLKIFKLCPVGGLQARTNRGEQYSWGWEDNGRICTRMIFKHTPINTTYKQNVNVYRYLHYLSIKILRYQARETNCNKRKRHT